MAATTYDLSACSGCCLCCREFQWADIPTTLYATLDIPCMGLSGSITLTRDDTGCGLYTPQPVYYFWCGTLPGTWNCQFNPTWFVLQLFCFKVSGVSQFGAGIEFRNDQEDSWKGLISLPCSTAAEMFPMSFDTYYDFDDLRPTPTCPPCGYADRYDVVGTVTITE